MEQDAVDETAQTVPIASLDPLSIPNARIHAIITLVWPYSSSTRTTSLLLAESDFRLRRNKGQVRVNFTDASAHRVATSGIGIGDLVSLDLAGSRWEASSTLTSTPGRSVDRDLEFSNRLSLRVTQSLSAPDDT